MNKKFVLLDKIVNNDDLLTKKLNLFGNKYNEAVKKILNNKETFFSDNLFIFNKSNSKDSKEISELIHYNFDNAEAYSNLDQEVKDGYKKCNTEEKILSKINREGEYPLNINIKDENGKIIGFLSAKKDNDGIIINRWHINPYNTGKGLGKLLIQKVLDFGIKNNFSYVKIPPSNGIAKEMLLRIGFEESKEKLVKCPKKVSILIKNLQNN